MGAMRAIRAILFISLIWAKRTYQAQTCTPELDTSGINYLKMNKVTAQEGATAVRRGDERGARATVVHPQSDTSCRLCVSNARTAPETREAQGIDHGPVKEILKIKDSDEEAEVKRFTIHSDKEIEEFVYGYLGSKNRSIPSSFHTARPPLRGKRPD